MEISNCDSHQSTNKCYKTLARLSELNKYSAMIIVDAAHAVAVDRTTRHENYLLTTLRVRYCKGVTDQSLCGKQNG